MARRRSYMRGAPVLEYRKLYIIATEGAETEPAYFVMFQNKETTIQLHVLDSKHKSAPLKVFSRAEQYVKKQHLRKKDEVWLVLDRDSWEENVLNTVLRRCHELNFKLAVSNPCFEYWLLLHFENGNGVSSLRSCRSKLLRYLPNFTKNRVDINRLKPGVEDAVRRADRRGNSRADWPHATGTTVYKLVRKLLVSVQ